MMNTNSSEDDLARRLLVSSYRLSAERILAGVAGSLAISNSREPKDSSHATGEVVGRCGQGGRHRFFRVDTSALISAAQAILGINRDDLDSLDQLAGHCQRLRRQTLFDTQAGCVNDQLPSIVPLLPPEEVWLDGRELPLDVWRLISFELDLVSTSISARVPIQDVAFGSLSQTGLAFRAMMARLQQRSVSFDVTMDVDPQSFGKLAPVVTSRHQIPLQRLFLDAGCLLTPIQQDPIAQWYAALRYADWFEAGARLTVRDEYERDSIDSRYRGLFAEEMAVGLMAIVLGDLFNAKPIVNTTEYFQTAGLPPNPHGQPVADFVAEAVHPGNGKKWTLIAESKGSLGQTVTKARLKHAKDQVSKTMVRISGTTDKLPLAFCSSVFFSNQVRDAVCLVVDPDGESNDQDIEVDPVIGWRLAMGKALRFVGLDSASRQVVNGEPATTLYSMSDSMDDRVERRDDDNDTVRRRKYRANQAREYFGADLILDVGSCALAMDSSILRVLRGRGFRTDTLETVARASTRRVNRERDGDGRSFFNYLGIGCVDYEDLDRR